MPLVQVEMALLKLCQEGHIGLLIILNSYSFITLIKAWLKHRDLNNWNHNLTSIKSLNRLRCLNIRKLRSKKKKMRKPKKKIPFLKRRIKNCQGLRRVYPKVMWIHLNLQNNHKRRQLSLEKRSMKKSWLTKSNRKKFRHNLRILRIRLMRV